MPQNTFNQQKKDILSKTDKSSKGNWDKKISKLCKKINSLENYYTTSSCSGRVVLMVDKEKKERGLFVRVYHDLISWNSIKKDLNDIIEDKKLRNKLIKFKLDPCILHVACRDIDNAKKLCDYARKAGWKRSGIIGFSGKNARVMVELNSTEKFEFPIIRDGKVLVDDIFLKIIVKESNKKLKKGWKKISDFGNLLK